MSVHEKMAQIKIQFSQTATWEDKYKKIIELGRKLTPMTPAHIVEDNKVKGCQSQVWLYASLNSDRTLHFEGDSDALIVKGLVAILIYVYDHQTPQDILHNPPDFLKELGFESNLSPSRSNGLFAMVKQIRNYALAFDYLIKSQP